MGVPNLRRVITPTVVAFREDVDVVYVPGAKCALPLLLVKLFTDSRDELRRVEVQMHLPHARNRPVRRSRFHRLRSAIGQTDHGQSRQNKSCLDEVPAIDGYVHDLVPPDLLCCVGKCPLFLLSRTCEVPALHFSSFGPSRPLHMSKAQTHTHRPEFTSPIASTMAARITTERLKQPGTR